MYARAATYTAATSPPTQPCSAVHRLTALSDIDNANGRTSAATVTQNSLERTPEDSGCFVVLSSTGTFRLGFVIVNPFRFLIRVCGEVC